jgi:8-oxo-dGTP pyrophosphatase MutT (NUDIX family)
MATLPLASPKMDKKARSYMQPDAHHSEGFLKYSRPLDDRIRLPTLVKPAQYMTKKSYGVACCRYNEDEARYEVLMVRKRYSYGFSSFVFGQYAKDDRSIIELLNNMTNQEKLDILSLNFDLLWWRIMLSGPTTSDKVPITQANSWLDIYKKSTLWDMIRAPMPKTRQELYIKKRGYFEKMFLCDEGARINRLIKQSRQSVELLWEIPKGRANRDEPLLDCAIREFGEETGVAPDEYTIMHDIPAFTYSYKHHGITYSDNYYVATQVAEIKPMISFSMSTQLSEIDRVKWVGMCELRYLAHNKHAMLMLTSIFKLIRNRLRKATPDSPTITFARQRSKDDDDSPIYFGID